MKDKPVRPIDAALARLRSTYTPGHGRPREDVDEPAALPTEEHVVPPAEELFWPPPGLERIHGELTRLSADFAVGVLILLLILVWLGFFAAEPRNAGGWGTMAALAINVLLLMRAYARLRQLLFYAYMAVTQGYPRRLIWQVAADAQRDTGMLLEGRGYYSGITKTEIAQMSGWRVTAAALSLFGWLWIPLVFPFIAVLGFLGVLRDAFTWLALLAPAAVLLIASAWLRYQEWRARQKFRARDILEREVAAQASAWSQLLTTLGLQRTRTKSTMELKLAMGAAWLAAFILLLPLGLTLVTTVIPRFVAGSGMMAPRFATLHVLQAKRTPADSSITDVAAGRALHTLQNVGHDPANKPLMQPPVRHYPAVFEDRQFTPANNPSFWSDSLFGRMRRRALTVEQRRLVEAAARHPAATDFHLLASARRIDIPATRWHLSSLDTVALVRLPYPAGWLLRDVAQSRIAAAGLAFERGANAEAEAALGEIISVGFLLRDEAPTSTDAFAGYYLLRIGGRSLASLYEHTGRGQEAAEIRAVMGASDAMPMESRGGRSLEAAYAYVLNRQNPRAARWEMFAALQTAAPCASLYAGIFGPTTEHKAWVERARAALVRTPSEEQYFRIVEKGLAAREYSEDPRCSPRVVRMFRPILTGY